MNLEDQVCSTAQSYKLKIAALNKDSYFANKYEFDTLAPEEGTEFLIAFTVSELMDPEDWI